MFAVFEFLICDTLQYMKITNNKQLCGIIYYSYTVATYWSFLYIVS